MSELLFRLEDRWGSILGTCIGVSVVIAFHYLIVWLRKEKKPERKAFSKEKALVDHICSRPGAGRLRRAFGEISWGRFGGSFGSFHSLPGD